MNPYVEIAADPVADAAPAVQAAVMLGQDVILDPGEHLFKTPVYLPAGSHVVGWGSARSTVRTYNGLSTAFVVGIPQVGATGEQVLARHRPDAYGVLDASAAWAAGIRAGVASCGEITGACVSHPLQRGAASLVAPGVCDEWSETSKLTLEIALAGTIPANSWVCGMGSLDNTAPSPFTLRTDSSGNFVFAVADSAGDFNQFTIAAGAGVLTANGTRLRRLACVVDLTPGGGVFARMGGSGTPATLLSGPGVTTGRTLALHRGDYPFCLFSVSREAQVSGTYPIPNLACYGLCLKATAAADPGSDALRYFPGYSPTTVAYLALTDVTPARHCLVTTGGAETGLMFLLHSNPTWLVPAYDVTLEAFSTVDGDVLSGPVMRFRAGDVGFAGKYTGFCSVPTVACYPNLFDDCKFSGRDAGCSFHEHGRLTLRDCHVPFAGNVMARFRGCNADWLSGDLRASSARTRAGVEIVNDSYGGRYRLQSIHLDSEVRGMTEGVIVAENSPGTPGRLKVDDLYAQLVGPGSLVKLRTKPGGGAANEWSGSGLYNNDPAARATVEVQGAGWWGRSSEYAASASPVTPVP